MGAQRQIGLRRKDVPVTRNKEVANKAYTGKPKRIPPRKDTSMNVVEPKGK